MERSKRGDSAPREMQSALALTLGNQGAWLFRRRSYLPLPLLAVLAAWLYLHAPADQESVLHWGWEVVCLLVGGVGFAIRLWVAGLVPGRTSGRNTRSQVAEVLNTTGPYSVVRHPLYVANFFMWMAVALFTRSPLLVTLVVLYFWGCYERIMIAEERFLADKFGEAFRVWAAATPAILPARSRWRPSVLPYEWKIALRREYSGMFGLLSALGLLEVAEEAGFRGVLFVDPYWDYLLAGATLLYIALRTLKRRSDVLRVPGR